MPQLNHLHTCHEPVDALVVCTRVPGVLEALVEVCAPGFREAKGAGARLVEQGDERDVEVCGVCAERQVDGCEGRWVRAVD